MKAVLFDADGVVLQKQAEYFSVRFAREYGAPLDKVTQFFKTKFRACQKGEGDLKEELQTLLPQWGWDKGVDAFLAYWFTTDAVADREVLGVVDDYRSRGTKCYLVSDQEKYRGDYMRTALGLDAHFDGIFFSFEVGLSKSQPEFFDKVLGALKLAPAEVVYWDDDQDNVDAAKSVGLDARFYKTITDLKI